MNSRNSSLSLIAAIILTLLALWVHQFLPSRHLVIFGDLKPTVDLFSTKVPDGSDAAIWASETKRHWRCNSFERPKYSDFVCSMLINLSSTDTGIDLSSYSTITIDARHTGSSKKIRLFVRNYDPSYSKPGKPDTNKFNTINIDTSDFNGPVTIPMTEFYVADWWLLNYNIPRKNSRPDLRNAVQIGFDFDGSLPPGMQDISIHQISFDGEWVRADSWYLGILSIWLAGVFLYAINQLRLLHLKTKEDKNRIRNLATQNESLKHRSSEFERLSTTDPLTKAFNRLGADQIIASLAARPAPAQGPRYSLILADIDHFKRVNDGRGHDAGDRVLQMFGEVIRQRIRKTDFLVRWGGEEFLIILPETSAQSALALAENLRKVVEGSVFEPQDPLPVTASFGIGQADAEEDFASTFKRVDTALYAAKHDGRNRCVTASQP